MIAAQQGALEAFSTLYERYLPMVYRRVMFSVPEADVEDVTQEIFIAVIRSLKNFRGESRFNTWLWTITSRQIVDYYRREYPTEARQDSEITDDDHLEAASLFQTDSSQLDEKMMLRHAFEVLQPQYREILLLRFADGLKFQEIAAQQGQSLEATKSMFRRAVSALQKLLEVENYA